MQRMVGYKLFKLRKDGSIGPLFINARQRIEVGVEYQAEDRPTKGFAHRPGWHICTSMDGAPHLKQDGKLGESRVWAKVEFTLQEVVERPTAQGGTWYLGSSMKVLEVMQ